MQAYCNGEEPEVSQWVVDVESTLKDWRSWIVPDPEVTKASVGGPKGQRGACTPTLTISLSWCFTVLAASLLDGATTLRMGFSPSVTAPHVNMVWKDSYRHIWCVSLHLLGPNEVLTFLLTSPVGDLSCPCCSGFLRNLQVLCSQSCLSTLLPEYALP